MVGGGARKGGMMERENHDQRSMHTHTQRHTHTQQSRYMHYTHSFAIYRSSDICAKYAWVCTYARTHTYTHPSQPLNHTLATPHDEKRAQQASNTHTHRERERERTYHRSRRLGCPWLECLLNKLYWCVYVYCE
jgi:hypothetical protein